jgi:hypothetical protein
MASLAFSQDEHSKFIEAEDKKTAEVKAILDKKM